MGSICVIDGDLVAYRSASTCEQRSILAKHSKTLEEFSFKTMTDYKAWVVEKEINPAEIVIEEIQTPEPIENALSIVKSTLARITKNAKCENYHVVVSGKGNFRLDLPLPTQYKSSRSENIRPVLLKDCIDYLKHRHGAEVSEGCEADDVLQGYMYQGYISKERIVVASLDKDARHGPGWLFDWTKMDEPEFIEGYGGLEVSLNDAGVKSVKGKGRAFLTYQILVGDPVDTYKPCELAGVKFGAMAAYKILGYLKSDKEAWEALVKKYRTWYRKPVNYKAWDNSWHTKDWLEIMQMYADCAFMRRWEGDRLDIKAVLNKLNISY